MQNSSKQQNKVGNTKISKIRIENNSENKSNGLYDNALANLQPSRELLDFYRRKVTDLTSDHDELIRKLEYLNETNLTQYKVVFDLKQREDEIADLQKALSDMQIYLFKEREQVLRLYAENDRLKIRELEDRKKIQQLLELSGLTQSEVTYFIKDPPSKTFVQPTQAITLVSSDGFTTSVGVSKKSGITNSSKNSNNATKNVVSLLEHESVKRELESYKVQIQALQSQLEEQTRLYKEQTDALMEDRNIRQQETEDQRSREQEKIQVLSEKLKRTQELLYENTKDFLTQRSKFKESERLGIAERDAMFRKLRSKELACETSSNPNLKSQKIDSSSLQNKAWNEWSGQMKEQKEIQYKNTINNLEYQLEQQQKMAEMYREQVIEMENELSQIREEGDATKDIYKHRSAKINSRLQLMNQRYKDLERRRNLEVQGFQTDITNLRKKLKILEKQLYTMTLSLGDQLSSTGPDLLPQNLDLAILREVKHTATKSNHLAGQLKDLKAMMYGLERELRQL